VAAILAIRAADSANRERDLATRVAQVATSRQLAAQSAIALRDGELGGALAQAARAWRTAHTGEARDALLAALRGARGVDAILHGPRARLAAVSGDRARVALLGGDERVTVLDLRTRRAVGPPLRTRVPVTPPQSDFLAVPVGLALDAHGDRLAVGYNDGSVDLWDVAAGKAGWLVDRGREGPTDGGALPVFSADGTRLAWGSGTHAISIWDGTRIRRLRAPEPIGLASWNVALSSDGRFVAAAGAGSGNIVLWRPGRAPRMLHGPRPEPTGVPVALGGGARPVLAVGGTDGRVRTWDAASGRQLRVLRAGRGRIAGLAFSPGGRRLAVVDPAAVGLFAARGARVGTGPALAAERAATPVDESGRVLTVGASGIVMERRPAARAGQVAWPLAGASEEAAPAFDPTGRRIAAVDSHSRLQLWDAADGRPVGAPLSPKLEPYAVRFLPDGRVLTCCGYGRGVAVRVWDQDGGGRVVRGRGEPADATAGPGGRIVVLRAGSDDLIVTGDGPALRIPSGSYSGLLSRDGRWLSVATDDGIDIWSLAARRRTASVRGDYGMPFSPVGPLVAVAASPGPIRLIDRLTGRVRGTLGDDLDVAGMEFSPDGRTLATVTTRAGAGGAERAALELWDVAARRRLGEEPLVERATVVDTVDIAFAPDGSRLVVSGLGTPAVFDLDVDEWAARAARLAAGGP
jgi:WD40 repeat protein